MKLESENFTDCSGKHLYFNDRKELKEDVDCNYNEKIITSF